VNLHIGIPVTQKGIATSFCVLSGHVPPGQDGAADWDKLAGAKMSTLVILMGTAKLGKIVEHLIKEVSVGVLALVLVRSA
jgi:siroheme synthase